MKWSTNSHKINHHIRDDISRNKFHKPIPSLLGFLHESCFQLHPNAIKLRRPVEDPPVHSTSRLPLKPFQREPTYSSYFSQKFQAIFLSLKLHSSFPTSFPTNFCPPLKTVMIQHHRVPTFEKPIFECRYLERPLNTLHTSFWEFPFSQLLIFFIYKLRVLNIGRSLKATIIKYIYTKYWIFRRLSKI